MEDSDPVHVLMAEVKRDLGEMKRRVAKLSFDGDIADLLLHAAELAGVSPRDRKQWAAAQFCDRANGLTHAQDWWGAIGVNRYRPDGTKRHICVCNKMNLAEYPTSPSDLCRDLLETCEWHTGSSDCNAEDVEAVARALLEGR